jgi:uncharacterized OB-fold protein
MMEAISSPIHMLWCQKCDKYYLPPRYMCPDCGNPSLEEKSVEGKGKIYSFTTIYYPPLKLKDRGPYEITMIELNNGIKLLGRIVDREGDLKIGKEVCFVRTEEGVHFFRMEK